MGLALRKDDPGLHRYMPNEVGDLVEYERGWVIHVDELLDFLEANGHEAALQDIEEELGKI